MPSTRPVLNAFTAKEVQEITGLSRPMIDYLLRAGFLRPHYAVGPGRRGKVRFYSYRDLVAARLVQRLRETGVELHKLKKAVQELCLDETWGFGDDRSKQLMWLVSDGKDVWLKSNDGFLDSFRRDRQRAFSFIVNLPQLGREVKLLVPPKKRKLFTLENLDLLQEAAAEGLRRK